MDNIWMGMVIGLLVAGMAVGGVWFQVRARARLKEALDRETRASELAALLEQLRTNFSALSREALSANADDFLKLAKTAFEQQTSGGERTLEEKKKLIDQRLEEMGVKLTALTALVQAVDKQRAESHGALERHLRTNSEATTQLQTTTAQLREALANPQRRGQWGERMAEDVLRLAGFIEGVNYSKQQTVGEGARPDFTFPLPGGRFVHMDAKFPLANYLKVLDATGDAARGDAASRFMQDVRNRVREVAKRTYIDTAAGTVDYALVFIANEQIYGFIHEHDPRLLDDALESRVVLCSPLTLYAILAVIRQASEGFRVEQNSRRILEHLSEFQDQWRKFVDCMEKMGRKLEEARGEFDALRSTRTRALDRQLDKIETLRLARSETSQEPTPALPPT
jgi:DNA recombination protein RmuC